MARYPMASSAKTRLAAALGPDQSAVVYDLCARTIFGEVQHLQAPVKRCVFFTGSRNPGKVGKWTGDGFDLFPQAGRDLGERLANAFSQLFTAGISSAILIASDVPDISVSIIKEAISALESHDIVLGPAHDGGYYLIGMHELHSTFFNAVNWGSEEVLRVTLVRAVELKLSCYLLPTLIDIDTIEDIRLWLSLGGTKAHEMREYIRTIDNDLFCRAIDYQI